MRIGFWLIQDCRCRLPLIQIRLQGSMRHLILLTLQVLHRHTKLASPLLPDTSLDSFGNSGSNPNLYNDCNRITYMTAYTDPVRMDFST